MLLRGLRRRWKIGVITFLVGFCGIGFFTSLTWGLAFGVLFGVCLPLILEFLDRTIKGVDDVHDKLGLNVLGTLPRFPLREGDAAQPERRLLTSLPPGESSHSAYRALCARLRSLGDESKVIMVTSCIPGEGKSTVSANLAVSLAEFGAKVLLIGCDLRRPALCELFGETHQPGLSDLLSGDDRSGLRTLSQPAIDFMPAGSVPSHPAELLDSESMREYVASIKERYNYVVLDAPPVLPVTDSLLLAPLCDLRLMVLEPCRISRDMAVELLTTLRKIGSTIDGVILNDRSGRSARHYSSPGEYGQLKASGKSRKAASIPSRRISPVGKLLVGTALTLAVVIAGLSWQILFNGKVSSDSNRLMTSKNLRILHKKEGVELKPDPPGRQFEKSVPAVVQVESAPPRIPPAPAAENKTLFTPEAPAPDPVVASIISTKQLTDETIELTPAAASPVIVASPEPSASPEPAVPVKTVVLTSKQPEKPVAEITLEAAPKTTAKAVKKTTVKVAPKTAAKTMAKTTAKTMAKTTAKTTAKTAAKTTGKITAVSEDLQTALLALAHSWNKSIPENSVRAGEDIKTQLGDVGLLASVLDPDLSSLLQCNTPLLLETRLAEAGTKWVAVVGRRGFKWQVSPQTRQGEYLSELDLKRLWTGKGYLPWQDPLQLISLGAGTDDSDRTTKLQQLLTKAGYPRQFEPGIYGRETIKAIGNLQAAAGLDVNGRMTPETLVLLYQSDPAFVTPKFGLW